MQKNYSELLNNSIFGPKKYVTCPEKTVGASFPILYLYLSLA